MSVYLDGSVTYLLSCLSPACALRDTPSQCNAVKWSANGFPLRMSEL